MTLQNEKFEELISDQLARQLEPQRGRAAQAFRAQIAAEAAAADAARIAGGARDQQSWARRQVSRAGSLFWIGMPSAIAAALALAVTLHFTRPAAPITPRHDDTRVANRDPGYLSGGGGGAELVSAQSEAPSLMNHNGITEINPGEILLLHQNAGNLVSPIRPTDYIQPANHPYPLNAPQPANNSPRQP